jgi:hypothetical protein
MGGVLVWYVTILPNHILLLRHCNKRNSTQAILQEHATLFQNFSQTLGE